MQFFVFNQLSAIGKPIGQYSVEANQTGKKGSGGRSVAASDIGATLKL
jgi:hypothetical protein